MLTSLYATVAPAMRRFREIQLACDNQAIAVPQHVEDGWEMFMRVMEAAEIELEAFVN